MKIKTLLTFTQEELKDYLGSLKSPYYDKIVHQSGLVFIPKGANLYPLMCMHMDTINNARHCEPPRIDEIVDYAGKISLSPSSTAQCLGGDDRCGVYIALELMKRATPYAFGFFVDEEVGCIGSTHLAGIVNALDTSCYIGLDRKGFNECALYGYDNLDLLDFFGKYGFEPAVGSITDASNLAAHSMRELACLNLSIGYYNEHTKSEFIIPSATQRTLNILSRPEVVAFLGSDTFIGYADYFHKGYQVYGDYLPYEDINAQYADEYWDNPLDVEQGADDLDFVDSSFDYDEANAEIQKGA